MVIDNVNGVNWKKFLLFVVVLFFKLFFFGEGWMWGGVIFDFSVWMFI